MVEREAVRAALAAAIERRDDILERLGAMRDAADRASQAIWGAQARLDEVKVSTEAARDAQIERFVTGETALAQRPVREARAAEADVEDDIEAARAAVEKIRQQIGELERASFLAQLRVTDAVGEVMRNGAVGVIAEAAALEERLSGVRAIISFVSSSGAASFDHPALAPWRAAYEALLHDASAALPEG